MNCYICASAYSKNKKEPGYQEVPSLTLINKKPLISYQVEALLNNGADMVYITYPNGNKDIVALFGTNPKVKLIPLNASTGEAGSLGLFGEKQEDILFVPGNLFFNVDLARFQAFHEEKGSYITALVHPEPYPQKKDILVLKKDDKGFIILPKETSSARDFAYRNIVPTDLCIISSNLLSTFDPDETYPLSFHDEVFLPTLAVEGLYGYRSSEYVIKVGQDKTIEEIEKDIDKGIPEKKNLKNPQKAFFLDRDGTLNIFGDFIVKADMLKLIPEAAEAVRRINESGDLAVCITNQPIVARGEVSISELESIMATLELELGKQGAYLDASYFCPHFPLKKKASVLEYTCECECRKPKIGMLLKAKEALNIDFESSWFIGDTSQDMQTGNNASTHTALVLSGDPHPYDKYPNAKVEIEAKNILEAVEKILF